MGVLILIAYVGFGIHFNYTSGDWVIAAVVWGIIYASGSSGDYKFDKGDKQPVDNNTDGVNDLDLKIIDSKSDAVNYQKKTLKQKTTYKESGLIDNDTYEILNKDELSPSEIIDMDCGRWSDIPAGEIPKYLLVKRVSGLGAKIIVYADNSENDVKEMAIILAGFFD